jgi:tetratricopeptide (TPR) repeat protein
MKQRYTTPELDELFERYRLAPESTIFAPLADACRKAGMVEEALLVCARGVKGHPRYASGYVVQGKCHFDAKRPDDAEASFRRVLEIDAHNLVALKYLGIIRAERGDAAEARGFFTHILELDPEDRDVHRRLEALGEAPAPARASAPRVTAPPEAPEDEETQEEIQEETQEEIQELRDVPDDEFVGAPITLRDDSVTSDEIATLTLADIYAAQGHAGKALRIYREVLRRQPDNDGLRRKVEALEGEPAAVRAPADPSPPVPTPAPEPGAPAEASPVEGAQERSTTRRPALPAPASGSPIDESRSYEQFKRWLRAMS